MSLICKLTSLSPYPIFLILSGSSTLKQTIPTLITPGPITGQLRITLTAQSPPILFKLSSLLTLSHPVPPRKATVKGPTQQLLSPPPSFFSFSPTPQPAHLVCAFLCGPVGMTRLLFLGDCEYNKNFSHRTNTRIHYF